MSETLLIGWTTCEKTSVAEQMARKLVEEKLAACVQIEPEVRSFYLWKGEVQNETECRLMIKFDPAKKTELEAFLQASHPYETHEWIVVRVDAVSPKYLRWALNL